MTFLTFKDFVATAERWTLPDFRALFAPAQTSHRRDVHKVIGETVAGRAGPIHVRRYLPSGSAPPGRRQAIFFLHGGAWVAGGLDSHDGICRHLAARSGSQVVAIDYRLAPEHPFPAAVEDAIDCHAMLLLRAAAWGVDPTNIVLAGDGSGGGLAAVVALHAREMCLPMPVAQLLLFPLLDLSSANLTADDRTLIDWVRDQYLPGGGDLGDWRLSPHQAKSLSGLPPALIAVDNASPNAKIATDFAARLRAVDVPVRLLCAAGDTQRVPALVGQPDVEAWLDEALRFSKALADNVTV